MLGWKGCETTSATLALATFPVMNAAVRLETPEPFVAVKRPVTDREAILAVLDVFRVVHAINGTVNVSKLKTVLDAFDVNPAVNILVVVTALAA